MLKLDDGVLTCKLVTNIRKWFNLQTQKLLICILGMEWSKAIQTQLNLFIKRDIIIPVYQIDKHLLKVHERLSALVTFKKPAVVKNYGDG